ncbi:hypothetical protein MAR_004649 [Mya arenaria]|uniref:Reverse transcriptase domain-containing protein n=1 Tax=Mya arenaria TaxID=6604 RepID=A0ABY7F002_MYAAR|nr:hypothetical protein MAR_004649 [Mya arenaria]
MLDTKMAFDTVWLDAIFDKTKCVDAHSNMSSFIIAICLTTEFFPVLQGICQGGIILLWIYNLFINGLLDSLERSAHGLNVINVIASITALTDGIALAEILPNEIKY